MNNITFCHFVLIVFSLLLLSCSSNQDVINNLSDNYLFSSEILELPIADLDKATEFSSIGQYENSLKFNSYGCPPKDYGTKYLEKFEKEYSAVPADEYIIEQAGTTSITMINGGYRMALYPIFVTNLLEGLYDKGYRHLGLEGICQDILPGDDLRYLDNVKGKEPRFANLIRKALDLGFTIFKVDSFGTKDSEQVEELKKRMEQFPDDKILIYVSSVHSIEAQLHESIGKTLANKISEDLNVNPLTIGQLTYTEKTSAYYESFLYKNTSIVEPVVFVSDIGESYFDKKYVPEWNDIHVFHPRSEFYQGRPSWLASSGNELVSVDVSKSGLKLPIMVYAIDEGEQKADAIPYDVVEVTEASKDAVLFLPPGKFDAVMLSANGASKSLSIVIPETGKKILD